MLYNFLHLIRPEVMVTLINAVTGEIYIKDTALILLDGCDFFTDHPELQDAEIISWEERMVNGTLDYNDILVYIDC